MKAIFKKNINEKISDFVIETEIGTGKIVESVALTHDEWVDFSDYCGKYRISRIKDKVYKITIPRNKQANATVLVHPEDIDPNM